MMITFIKKIISLYIISKHSANILKFALASLYFDAAEVKNFSKFDKEIFINWQKYLASTSDFPLCIFSYSLWYNRNILINDKTVYISSFSMLNSLPIEKALTIS